MSALPDITDPVTIDATTQPGYQGLPLIDGVAVPIVNNVQNTRTLALPQAWVENRHRAGVAT